MKALGIVFIFIMAVLTLVSVKTAIPDSGGMRTLIGYKTCCPFATASTAIGVTVVLILFFLAQRVNLF